MLPYNKNRNPQILSLNQIKNKGGKIQIIYVSLEHNKRVREKFHENYTRPDHVCALKTVNNLLLNRKIYGLMDVSLVKILQ